MRLSCPLATLFSPWTPVTPVVRALLIANVGMFFLQSMQPMVVYLLVFVPREVLFRPWTVLTYMFLHGGLMHLLFNMLSLFWFGPRVEERMGSRKFTMLYVISGVSGAARMRDGVGRPPAS